MLAVGDQHKLGFVSVWAGLVESMKRTTLLLICIVSVIAEAVTCEVI